MDIKQQIRNRILSGSLNGKKADRITDDTPLLSSGILDSISMMELIDFLEETFQVEFQPRELKRDSFETISIMAELIARKRSVE